MHLLGLLSIILGAIPVYAATPGRFLSITAGTQLSTRTYVHFYIENEMGQRTGQLPNGHRVAEIPGTEDSYGTEALSNDMTHEPGFESVGFAVSDFPAGDFKLVLLPQATSTYFLRLDITNDNYSSSNNDFEGYAVAGTSIVYKFEFQPTNSTPTPVMKTVTLASLRESVLVAMQVGQLGDTAFATRLDKLLARAQSDVSSGKNKQAGDRLDQFIHRLDSAFKKESDLDGGDDTDDKKNASTMKRFVVKTARDSLSGDARTLIAGFGEQSRK